MLDPFVIVNNRNAVINLPTFHKNYREAVALMAKKRDTETCVKSTFYVGKGKGDRCFFHLKAATYYYHNSVPYAEEDMYKQGEPSTEKMLEISVTSNPSSSSTSTI